jgi:hypothetical protein
MTDFATPPDFTIPEGATPAATPDAPAERFEAPPMYRRPNQRAGMTVWAGTGEVEHHGAPVAPTSRPPSGPIKPTFQSPTGGPAMLKDLGPDTLVVDPTTGEVSSNLASLMAAGLIRETADGWELAGPDGRFHEPSRTTKADRQEAADDDDDADADETARHYLPTEHEAALAQLEAKVGAQLFSNIEQFFLTGEDGQEMSENLISQVGVRLNTDRDGALAAIQQGASFYIQQAAQVVDGAVGAGAHAEVFEFGRSTPEGRKLLQEASRRQVEDRDSSGYVALTKAWLIHQSRLDPHRIASGITAGGTKAAVKDNKVIITLPGKGGQVSLDAALRGGVLDLKKL